MKRLYSKDLGIIFLLTAVYILLISFPNFTNKYILDIGFFILFFLFTGYSLIALIRPEEDYKDIMRKPVLILEFSILLTLAVSIILRFSYLGLHIRSLVMVLSIITMVISISAYIRRINHYNSMKYDGNLKPDQIKEVSDNIKELTKSSVKMEEADFEEQVKPEPQHDNSQQPSIKDQGDDLKTEKLVVAEDRTEQNSINHVEPARTKISKPKPGYLKMVLDLILIELLSIFILASFFVKPLNIGIFHYITGLLYMLFLVGYPILKILVPKRNSLNKKLLIGLSIGLSLPTTSIIGLVLNSTKYGLSVYTLLFPLVVLTIVTSMFAFKRVKNANT